MLEDPRVSCTHPPCAKDGPEETAKEQPICPSRWTDKDTGARPCLGGLGQQGAKAGLLTLMLFP